MVWVTRRGGGPEADGTGRGRGAGPEVVFDQLDLNALVYYSRSAVWRSSGTINGHLPLPICLPFSLSFTPPPPTPPRLRYDVTLLRSRDNLCESVSSHQIRLLAQLEKQNGTFFLSLGIVLTTYSPPPHRPPPDTHTLGMLLPPSLASSLLFFIKWFYLLCLV